MTRRTLLAGLAAVVATAALLAGPAVRAGSEPINYADINKIKAEGLQNSQVMELASWLTDVYAPRLTGSPTFLKAAEWTVAKMKEWGLANAKIEPWANRNGFERGWTNDKFYLSAVAPERFPIPGTPAAWTPGTNGLVSGEVVLVTAMTEAELAPYKGTLRGKWVLTQAAPDVAAYWKPLATRYTAEELAELESWPAPQPEFGVAAPGAGRMGGPGPGPGAPAAQAPQAGGRQGQPGQPAAAAQPGIVPPAAVQAMMRGTAAAEALSPGQIGTLTFVVGPAAAGQAPRRVTLAGAVLTGADVAYEQAGFAEATLRFVAEAADGLTDPHAAEDAQ
ncbi:MAG TPA: hypothetical protein PLN93_08430 [Vicinamibacterales bacterium]|nr:hypothetical protein [Vicinamibacterales bacterium]